MATLEPTLAIQTLEDALRQLMSYVYTNEYGAAWLEKISSQEQRDEWTHRAEQEQKKRGPTGAVAVPAAGLAYSDLKDLLGIVNKHWDPLKPALNNRGETRALLTVAERLRNTAQHGRQPLVHEADLLSGIAGQIRNQVTIFMNTQDTTGNFYPRIESVVDSHGHIFQGGPGRGDQISWVPTDFTLPVGQPVIFTCTAFDPQDRSLRIELVRGQMIEKVDEAHTSGGQPVTLTWVVQEADVNTQAVITVKLWTQDSKYHRWNSLGDAQVNFIYQVFPPQG
jgi:hypothetical protein